MSNLSIVAAAAESETAVAFALRGWYRYWISYLFEKWLAPWLARFSLIQYKRGGRRREIETHAVHMYELHMHNRREKKSINNRSSFSCRCRSHVYYKKRKWNDTKSIDWIWHRWNEIKPMSIIRRNICIDSTKSCAHLPF